jgi:hypothetical protein
MAALPAPVRRTRGWAIGLVAVWSIGCGARPPSAASRPSASPPLAATLPRPRFAVLPDPQADLSNQLVVGAARASIVLGQRLLQHPGGRVERARELLPDRAPRAVVLPEHLGGGFLFFVSSGTTSVWRAKSWTGELKPLAHVEFDVDDIRPGFDRIHLFDKRSGDILSIDPDTGRGTSSGSLPTAAAHPSVAVADAWFGAVETPYRGVMATFDAGASWQVVDPLGGNVRVEGSDIVVARGTDELVLDPMGAVQKRSRPVVSPPADAADDDDVEEPARSVPETKLDLRLRDAVLRGFPIDRDRALLLANGTLSMVKLSDGGVEARRESAAPPGSECVAVTLGRGVGFVCHEEASRTTLYRYEPPLGLVPLASYAAPRYVSASGRGAVIVRGSCAEAGTAHARVYCVWSAAGQPREVAVKGAAGAERVAAVSTGEVAVLLPPRHGAPGSLSWIGARGRNRTVALRIPELEPKLRRLVERGLWLEGLTELGDGALATWIAGGDEFVGVRVARNGRVTVGRPGQHLRQSWLSGTSALELVGNGLASETLDGGFTWSEVEVPPGLEPGKVPVSGRSDLHEQGCSRVGCALGTWIRIGWWGRPDRQALPLAARPELTAVPPSGGGRWSMTCAPTGVVAGPDLKPSADESADRREAWPSFLGVAPPQRRAGDAAFSHATSSHVLPVRGYVWGPEGPGWNALARIQLRISDRFASEPRLWSTAPSRAPWPDSVTAAQAFGDTSAGGYSHWSAVLDGSGRAGALLVKARGTSELFMFEEDRPLQVVRNAASSGIGELAGVARLGTDWYVAAALRAQAFHVFRVEGGQLRPFAELPDRRRSYAGEGYLTRLVRSARGDALGIWVQVAKLRGSSTSWYIYPLDLRTGRAGEPIELEPAQLGTVPPACADDASGYVLQGPLPVEPYFAFTGSAEALRTSAAEARLIVDGTGALCVDQLAAVADGPLSAALSTGSSESISSWAAGKATTTLTLRAGPGGARRASLRCAH